MVASFLCSAFTAFHAQELGFRTILVEDCCRGIQPDAIQQTYERVKVNNGVVCHSSEVKAMVQGRDRRVELGYQLALECRKKIIYPPKTKNSKYNPVIGTSPGGSTTDNINDNNSNQTTVQASA